MSIDLLLMSCSVCFSIVLLAMSWALNINHHSRKCPTGLPVGFVEGGLSQKKKKKTLADVKFI